MYCSLQRFTQLCREKCKINHISKQNISHYTNWFYLSKYNEISHIEIITCIRKQISPKLFAWKLTENEMYFRDIQP